MLMKNSMTIEQYHERIDKLTAKSGYFETDGTYLKELDELRKDLIELILNNTETPEFSGTAYYVSNSGDDNNDGLTKETAWATLDKVANASYKKGDAVLFERGGIWRGTLCATSGVTYSAFGTGAKPRLYSAYDGMSEAKWLPTQKENVWVFDKEITDSVDIGNIVFNEGSLNADKKQTVDSLENDYEFVFTGKKSENDIIDNKVYLYCSKGNPAEVFTAIDLTNSFQCVSFDEEKCDVTLYNLDIRYGTDYFFTHGTRNIKVVCCYLAWHGGTMFLNQRIRAGGGGGAWQTCDGMLFDRCYFYQHFDAAFSPQFNTGKDNDVTGCFKDFIAKDCVVEKSEWSFEYFFYVNDTEKGRASRWINCHSLYNIYYDTGGGFGDKTHYSACVMGDCGLGKVENCTISKNIFDRALNNNLCINAHTKNSPNKFELKNNLHVTTRKDCNFAVIDMIFYSANEKGFNEYLLSGEEKEPVMVVINK